MMILQCFHIFSFFELSIVEKLKQFSLSNMLRLVYSPNRVGKFVVGIFTKRVGKFLVGIFTKRVGEFMVDKPTKMARKSLLHMGGGGVAFGIYCTKDLCTTPPTKEEHGSPFSCDHN
jgi:hypothetical protein